MKIIDLLNKIANGEEVPEIILFNSYKYRFDKIDKVYRNINGNSTLGAVVELDIYLNDNVKIIKEEKKIPEKLSDILRVDDLIPPVDENMYKIWQQTIKNQNKINEILDYLKSKGE